MKFSDLNNLDIHNIGSWPVAAKAIAIAFLCAGLLGAGYWYESKHQLPELDAAKQKEKQLRDEVSIKATKAANLEAYKQQFEEMKQSFGAMLRQLPNKTEVAALLVDISQTGLASGLEFELFKPEAEAPRDFYAELPISIRVNGNYHDLGNFASGVAALPRIVTLHDINVKPIGDTNRLTMSLTAKTYRYLEEEETAK